MPYVCNITYLILRLNELEINSLSKHRILPSNSVPETTGLGVLVVFLEAYYNKRVVLP